MIDFTTLFTRLGQIGGVFNALNTQRGTYWPSYTQLISDDYAPPDLDLIDGLWAQLESLQGTPASYQQYLQTLATDTVIQMMNEDTPLPSLDIVVAIQELIRQMESDSQTLQRPTVSAGSPAYGASNRGDGVLVATLTDGFGDVMYTPFNETVSLICTSDASTGATNFNEPWFLTTPITQDPLSWLYPQLCGSGISLQINSTNPQVDNQQGNVLTNSDFETFAGSPAAPSNWIITTGAAGTDILNGGSGEAYYGSGCLEFTYDAGAPTSALNQPFGNSTTGTGYTILPDTAYAVTWRAKRSAGLSGAGALQIALVNASTLVVIADDAGTNNVSTTTASTLDTDYDVYTAIFRTPRALPAAGVALQVKMSTAIADSGESVFVDYLAMTQMTRLYGQGPLVALFSGGTPWAQGDTITVAINNNFAGGFLILTDRWFPLRANALAFPTASSPSISDSLISV